MIQKELRLLLLMTAAVAVIVDIAVAVVAVVVTGTLLLLLLLLSLLMAAVDAIVHHFLLDSNAGCGQFPSVLSPKSLRSQFPQAWNPYKSPDSK